jgi:putative spermidine/putrescine transport system ATP-binding protein
VSISIRLQGCGKTFADGSHGLHPLDLTINKSETLVFLGPSGCGKTTTLRIIAGLDAPDPGGKIWFGEQDVTDIPVERRNVGMVFQSYALFPNMTVAENVGYGLRVRRVPLSQRKNRVAQLLKMMRIEHLGDRHVDHLSGGQRQRVALARALAIQPQVLLLDEPLTALDAKLRESLRVEIDRLLDTLGITAVYVTHDQGEAMALGDRIVIMREGCVAQIGTPREIYSRPADRFVATFIGDMNSIPGEMKNGHFVTDAGRIPWPGAPNDSREVFFRPESVHLSKNGGPWHVQGKVGNSFFMGDHVRLLVDGIAAAPLLVEASPEQRFAPGESVYLTVDSAGLFSFPGQL